MDADERRRLTERLARLRESLRPLREAAEGEEPLFDPALRAEEESS